MDTRAFLDRVLPDSGGQYFSCYGIGPLAQSEPLDSLDDLAARIEARKRKRENIYFAVGTYSQTRTIAQALTKKCLYIDIDCGPGKPYTDKRQGVLALKDFCVNSKFPFPNILIDSGGGVHCYWTLDEPISRDEWQPLADGLKQLTKEHQFNVDHAITSDAARILRVPGSFNYKDPTHPRECKVLKSDPNDFTLEQLRSALAVQGLSVPPALSGQADADDLAAGLYGERTYHAGEMIQNCAVLKHTMDTGGAGQPGMMWHKIMHLLAYTEDGGDYIHAMSNKHAEYDAKKVDARFEYSVKRKHELKPVLCKTFEGFMPSKCATCKFKDNIRTPLVLGKTTESYLPANYKMTKEGICKARKTDPNEPLEWVLVVPYQLTDVEFMDTVHGHGLKITFHNPPKSYTLVVPGVMMASDTRELSKFLMAEGIKLSDPQVVELKNVMIPWMHKMERVKEATRAQLTGLGWTNTGGKVGFANGRSIFLEDGSTAPVSGLDKALCREYSPVGEESAWRNAVAAVTADQCPPIVAAVLSAFAAPLIYFTGVSGVMFSLHSRQSGTAKSSSLRVAQSVWGDPMRGVNSLHDTANAMAKKFGFLNNLPAYWDEVRARDQVTSFVSTIFQLGQGKEKQRMNSHAKMQEMGTWATMTTIATNEPILDHIDHIVGNTNAGRLRVFEVEVPVRPLQNTQVPFLLQELNGNFGHVGEDYAKWLAKNAPAVRLLVQKTQELVTNELEATNDERFWVALATVLLVAGMIASKRGYVQVDSKQFKRWLYGEFKRQRGLAGKEYEPLQDRARNAVIEFAEKHRDQLIVTDHASSKGKPNVGVVYVQPISKEIVGLIARKDRTFRVKRDVFRDWVYKALRDSPTDIIDHLVKTGAQVRRASVTAGLANTLDARVTVLDINLNDPSFNDILEPTE